MATATGPDFHVRVGSRSLVKASDSPVAPYTIAFSNLDLLPRNFPVSIFAIYKKPTAGAGGGFDAVVAAFTAALPSLLRRFLPFAGRIVTNPRSGLPELLCSNAGAELIVGEASKALASLDFGRLDASLRRVQLPYAGDLALSVQLVAFPCGGFSVAWCSNHVISDGHGLCMLISTCSELVRSGKVTSVPNHDRTVFSPRAVPAYSASVAKAFAPWDGRHLVNVLTAESALVHRLYYLEERDISRLRALASAGGDSATRIEAVSAYVWKLLAAVVGASDTSCRMGWWVDGRRRLKGPKYAAAMRGYVGNVLALASREAGVEEIKRQPLSRVAAMAREAIAAAAREEHFQELVDWAEEHRAGRYVEALSVGLGSPAVALTSFSAFALDTDFGLGHAALVMGTSSMGGRLCSGYLQAPEGMG